MIQLPDVDKFVWVWYKETDDVLSKYMSYLTEYQHNKDETER